MKNIAGLYVIICLMQLVTLINITLFNGEWNGFALWLCTGLFIGGTAFYISSRKKLNSK
ncbi:hypothetical protein [Bacillus sp. FSL R12-0074]|uniref:hypothetical protein n=1 Tax=Bacillus sp. FSL R12-0074 TaxID=2954664 RepID=UPI0014050B32